LISGRLARSGTLEQGWLEVRGERIAAVGSGSPPRRANEHHDGIIAPGLCDLQVNGAGGYEVTGGPAALDAIDAIQLEHGVTSYLPTIVPTDDATVERSLEELAERVADPSSPVAGAHLEGPFLSAAHAGMHPTDRLRSPVDGVPAYLASEAVRLVTIAPELPGALDLIAALRERGVAVSLGHSGASADVARAALDAGARLVTHVFNAMAPLQHRAPGLVGIALTDPRATVSVIADGVHADPLVLELVRRAAGPRVVLVSDAAPAAAAPAGRYRMAGTEIDSDGSGVVRTPEGRLAGSALTLDVALRNWASMTEATLGEAIAAAGERPARALGLARDIVGAQPAEPAASAIGLQPGAVADIVLLDDAGAVERVMRHGRWLS
jgi:N-acetylglucosamine-6-phosphate deacetylase